MTGTFRIIASMISFRSARVLGPVCLLLHWSVPAWSCEPIAVWVVFAGPHLLPMSLMGLVGIVAVKCLAFAVFDRNLGTYRRPLYMLIANLFSSVVGFALAFPFAVPAAPMFFVVAALILGGLSGGPAMRLSRFLGKGRITGGQILVSLVGCMFLTMVLFSMASGALDARLFWTYWLLKVGYIGVAFAVSICVSTLLEEWAISFLWRKENHEISFMVPVFKANLVAFLVGSAVGAAYMLPKRLGSPNFLAQVFDFMRATI